MNKDVEKEIVFEDASRKVLAYGGNLMVVENYLSAGRQVSLHSHPHEQISYIVSGKHKMFLGDEACFVEAGDSVYVPPNVLHGTECIEGGIVLDAFTPIREDFLAKG